MSLPPLEYANDFLDFCADKKSLSVNTIKSYRSDLLTLNRFLKSKKIIRIGRKEIECYFLYLKNEKKLGANSLKRHYATIRCFFKWLFKNKKIKKDPFVSLDFVFRSKKELPRALRSSEIINLIRNFDCFNDDFDGLCLKFSFLCMITTGIRVGELSLIEITDLDIRENSIKIHGKGNRERVVYFPCGEVSSTLEKYLSLRARLINQNKLLLLSNGKPLTPQKFRRYLHKISKIASLERVVTPHMLRHTAATRLIEAGVDIRLVQRQLGHASITTTEIYTHVTDNALKAAIARANVLERLGEKPLVPDNN